MTLRNTNDCMKRQENITFLSVTLTADTSCMLSGEMVALCVDVWHVIELLSPVGDFVPELPLCFINTPNGNHCIFYHR